VGGVVLERSIALEIIALATSAIDILSRFIEILDTLGLIDRTALAYVILGYEKIPPRKRYNYEEIAQKLLEGRKLVVEGSRRRIRYMVRRLTEITGKKVLTVSTYIGGERVHVIWAEGV
jgi:hypothetical protein